MCTTADRESPDNPQRFGRPQYEHGRQPPSARQALVRAAGSDDRQKSKPPPRPADRQFVRVRHSVPARDNSLSARPNTSQPAPRPDKQEHRLARHSTPSYLEQLHGTHTPTFSS